MKTLRLCWCLALTIASLTFTGCGGGGASLQAGSSVTLGQELKDLREVGGCVVVT